MSDTSPYSLGSLVWLKQPDYPWWPGVVIDATEHGLSLPEHANVCVQCYPSDSATVAFANSNNTEELRLFNGDADEALVKAAATDPDCAAALKEAQALYTQPLASAAPQDAAKETEETAARDVVDDATGSVQLDSLTKTDGGAAERRHERHRHNKEKKERRSVQKARHRERHRGRHESDDEESISLSDDEDSYVGKKRHKRERQSHLEEYPAYTSHPTEDDAEYYYRRCRSARQRVSNEELLLRAKELEAVIVECIGDAGYEAREDNVLSILAVLATYDVSFEQLRDTKIGVVVGQFLKKKYPARVRELANAILLYWFRSLPQNMQRGFVTDSELDRCSVDTTVGTRSEDIIGQLGAVGVHIFESFTDEEIYDAPPGVNVVEICKELEDALHESGEDKDLRVMVLSAYGDPSNSTLRRATLEGKVSAHEVLSHIGDLRSFMRQVARRGLRSIDTQLSGGSPTSPYSPFTPNSPSFSNPVDQNKLGNITTLFACPNCGFREAYRSEYSVQAHDNFPEILRCVKCDTTWNTAE